PRDWERVAQRADAGADLLACEDALRRAHRLLDAVAGVGFAQHELGAAQGLDAALAVDLLDRHVGPHLLELTLTRPAARQRRDERDLDVLGGRRGPDEESRGDERQRQ